MGQPESIKITMMVCSSLLPQIESQLDANLYTIQYMEFFFNNQREREAILARQTGDMSESFKSFQQQHSGRKGLTEAIYDLIEPSIRHELRHQVGLNNCLIID